MGYGKRIVMIIRVIAVLVLVISEYAEAIQGSLEPIWVKLFAAWDLPDLVPDGKRIKELETLRIKHAIPHYTFALRILGSPTTTRKAQRILLEILRIQYPGRSEKELFRMAITSRLKSLPLGSIAGQELDQVMEGVNSFDDLCDYITALNEQEQSFPDPLGIGKQIDDILAQEEEEKKVPAVSLINSIEKIYAGIKDWGQADHDEHSLLANTWLRKYGSTEEAEQKGAELTKYIAYKDTLVFSILDPPKSTKALALFLVYKELGEECASYYTSDFYQLIRAAIKSIENGSFLGEYKRKNPHTWKEAKNIKAQLEGTEVDLYSLLMGMDSLQHSGARDLSKKILEANKEKRYDEGFVESVSAVTLTMIVKVSSADFLRELLESADETIYREFSTSGESALKKAKLEMVIFTMFATTNTCLANEVPFEAVDKILSRLFDGLIKQGLLAKEERLMLEDLLIERSISYTNALQNQLGSGPMHHFGKAVAKNAFSEAIDERKLLYSFTIGSRLYLERSECG